MRFIRSDKETQYFSGTSNYYSRMAYRHIGGYGMGFGEGFDGWHGTYAPAYYSPGYYQENTYYYIKNNIFDLKNKKLV
jgi:hypothetical protein